MLGYGKALGEVIFSGPAIFRKPIRQSEEPEEVEEPEYEDLSALGRRNTVAANKDLLDLIDQALLGLVGPQGRQPGSPSQDARYLVATTQATTTAAATATTAATVAPVVNQTPFHCWTCQSTSITDCQNSGSNVECHQGDYGGCMVEMYVESGTLRELKMGCKQPAACEQQKSVNFWDFLGNPTVIAAREAHAPYDRFTVCKPETANNSYQPRSKCTQCCTTDNCFNQTGYTNGNAVTTTWADIQSTWTRTEWKSTL